MLTAANALSQTLRMASLNLSRTRAGLCLKRAGHTAGCRQLLSASLRARLETPRAVALGREGKPPGVWGQLGEGDGARPGCPRRYKWELPWAGKESLSRPHRERHHGRPEWCLCCKQELAGATLAA